MLIGVVSTVLFHTYEKGFPLSSLKLPYISQNETLKLFLFLVSYIKRLFSAFYLS